MKIAHAKTNEQSRTETNIYKTSKEEPAAPHFLFHYFTVTKQLDERTQNTLTGISKNSC